MKHASARVGIGTRFLYEGEVMEVVKVCAADGAAEVVARQIRTDTVCRIALDELMYSERSRLLDENLAAVSEGGEGNTVAVSWSRVDESERTKARRRAAHVREALTGYRSGSSLSAEIGEPRADYLPHLPKGRRLAAKAKELHVGQRTFARWVSKYEKDGEVGLLSAKGAQPEDTKFKLFEQTALDVMRERINESRPTRDYVIAHARARLIGRYGKDIVPMPSQATAYRILRKLERIYPLFSKSTKRNRDIAGRPVMPYGQLLPSRPGEYLLMDTTPLDVYAMDPHSLRWVGVQLTVAMDWYSRCIVGLRLTPFSTKAVDAAAVLYQAFRPVKAGRDWPEEAVWPPHGMPRSVLVDIDALDPAGAFAAHPAVVPETLVIDGGKIFIGEHLTSACRRLGISIQPARVRVAHDKGPVERFFKSVRQGFLQELQGYKGPDIYSRGVSPEQDAFYFLDELEALLREWVAVVYHRRPHDGLGEAGLWSLRLSPAQMFEHGIARAGYIEVPRDPCLAYHFLAVEWRTIQHYGFEIDHRYYRGKGLAGYTALEASPYRDKGGKWPVHVDPDDVRQVYFFDLKSTKQWHALPWTHAADCEGPMNEDGLHFAREMAKTKHRHVDDKLALAEFLERRNLSQGHTMAERRAALRLSREQSNLSIDASAAAAVVGRPDAKHALSGHEPVFNDELDDDPNIDDGHFYDQLLEEL